jgi:type IV pilus assembly protein PilY1
MSTSRPCTRIRQAAAGLALGLSAAFPASSSAAPLNLSQTPLFIGGNVDPNIVVTLDDSGSMAWGFMPDNIGNPHSSTYPFGSANRNRGLAANWNRLAYDPAVTYATPVDEVGAPLNPTDATTFTRAFDDGYRHALGQDAACPTVNLATSYRPTWGFGTAYTGTSAAYHCNTNAAYPTSYWYQNGDYRIPGYWNGPTSTNSVTYAAEPAFYYVFYANHPSPGLRVPPTGCGGDADVANDACYRKVVVSTTSGVNASDERQNFANWYSYYRKRHLAAKAGMGKAFSTLATAMRVGFGRINYSGTLVLPVRQFETTNRASFFDALYGSPAYGGTPLRRAADAVGQYFTTADPWYDVPGQSGRELQCRQSYHILTSDGYWNGDAAATSGARANVDNTQGPSITLPGGTTYRYQPQAPFKDGYSSTLADVAMYYWNRDLRPVANEVPKNAKDPAVWQHLVTFSVGLGIGGGSGHVDPAAAFAAIGTGATINWPQPSADSEYNIDDMLHAAVNSRGGFYSAQDPEEFADALIGALRNIIDRTGSAASVSLNSGTLQTGSRVYQARFNTLDWSGQLLASNINADGTVGDVVWDAGLTIPAWDDRLIATFDGTTGVPFEWTSLTAGQKAALDSVTALNATATSSPVLSYLRGDPSREERNLGTYRNRASSVLGDIVNSAPLYVGAPPEEYLFDDYAAFKAANAGRDPAIYVGANDGMLHAFDASSGIELWAFVPASVIGRLAELTSPNYSHRYYVDGGPGVADAFIGGQWRTVLVGGLNAGGQGIYALDVTSPAAGDDDDVAANVLWEFTDQNPGCGVTAGRKADCDLGYTFSQPVIVRVRDGTASRWVAVFGNGYNSTFDNDGDGSTADEGDGKAALFLVDLASGELVKKIGIPVTAAPDPLGQSRPNGLGTVAAVDRDGDHYVDRVYAGDLFGNLWSFDLSSASVADWRIAYGTAAAPIPLFQARAGATAATAQPITTRPEVSRPPSGGDGLFVLFGTGKYIEVSDRYSTGQTTQSFYAIWDRAGTANAPTTTTNRIGRTHLLRQSILAEQCVVAGANAACTDTDAIKYRITSDHGIRWYGGTGLPADPDGTGTPAVTTDDGYLGWYIDLYNTQAGNTNNYGERQVTNSVLRDQRVIFTTAIPDDDPCRYGGRGWIMELDARDGSRLDASPFDVNGDGVFDLSNPQSDFITAIPNGPSGPPVPLPSSGVDVPGMPSAPTIINLKPGASSGGGDCTTSCCPSLCGEGLNEMKYVSTSLGGNLPILGNPPNVTGRQSWRELIK